MFYKKCMKLWCNATKQVACLFVALPLAGQAATLPPSFGGTSEPDWTIRNYAWLTAAGRVTPPAAALDPAGQGWLRLTDALNGQTGSAVNNHAFSSKDGLQAEFEYATWGGSGADGFSFYLLDGSVSTPTTGASDGSLGYSSWGPQRPGVPKGYIGIGFDEYGNFSNGAYGGCSNTGTPSCIRTQNSIAVRGRDSSATGNGTGNYPLLAKVPVPQGISTGNRANARKVRITITPAPTILLTVEVDFNSGSGYQKIINALDITILNGAPPATFKMGFSGGTGGANNIHEVRLLGVQGARTASVNLDSTPPKTCGASPTTLTATVSGSDPQQIPSGTITFMEGNNILAIAPINGGIATLQTVLPSGSHNVVAKYSGDSAYSDVDSAVAVVSGVGAICTTNISYMPAAGGQCGPMTLTATLSTAAGVAPPTGTILFKDGGVALSPSAAIDSSGSASWTGSLSSGNHPISLEYSGDANYAASTAGIFTQEGNNPVCGTPDVKAGIYTATTKVNEPVNIPILHLDASSDPIGAPLAAHPVQPDTDPSHAPSHGSIKYSNGVMTYTPNPGYVGTDSFKYLICTVVQAPYTAQGCAVAVVNVTVTPIPLPAATPVPALETWGLLSLSSLLAVFGFARSRRRQNDPS